MTFGILKSMYSSAKVEAVPAERMGLCGMMVETTARARDEPKTAPTARHILQTLRIHSSLSSVQLQ